MEQTTDATRKHKRKKRWTILLIIVIVLVIIRLILPYVVLHFANKSLSQLKGYNGHVEDIDLAIYRGAYKIKNLYIHKVDSVSHQEVKFFDVRLIDLSVEWRAIFHGQIVGELELDDPELRFTKGKAEPDKVKNDSSDFRKVLNNFMPLRINRFEIMNGVLKYVDEGSKPPVDIQLDNAHILVENLTNVHDTTKLLPAYVKADANVYGGTINFEMRLDPFADQPTFNMKAELKNTELPKLNNFFKAYGKFDVSKGTFGLYTEMAAKQGKFAGYVKPVIKDLKVLGPEDKDKDLFHKFWEGLVGTVGFLFKNQRHDQLATKIPLEGTFKKTEINMWYTISEVLSNAFIQALRPSVDNEINMASVNNVPEKEKSGFFKKLFGKDEEKKDKKDEEKDKDKKKEKKEEKNEEKKKEDKKK